MIDPKLFKLTKSDKLHYQTLIKKIDPSHTKSIVTVLRHKIKRILDDGNLNSVEVGSVDYIIKLNNILLKRDNLTDISFKKILFAMSFIIDENI